MANNIRKKQVYLIILMSLLLSLIACRIEAPRIVLEESPTPVPTKIITQIITQIIVPTVSEPETTPAPPESIEPTMTPTWDPLSAPIYYPLDNCVASRLHIGDIAMVSLVGGNNAIRTNIDITIDSNIVTYAKPGETVTIISGPSCSSGFIMWFVETKDGFRGFTPEGNGNEYWLWPTAP